MSHFKVSVNENEPITLTSEELMGLDIHPITENEQHVLYQNKGYYAQIKTKDFNHKEFEVKINNNLYNVNIFSELDVLIKDMGFEVGASKFVNDIKAPMPGLILDIQVTEGNEVQEGSPLLILEAMKMENVLTSPRSGIIKSIKINKGDAVDKNQLLIEFE
ncbi:acetyl-CoA carboxylase biotin carboxyl carrier protein subunit [Mangrovimonas futianensis]|uniref:acetyl-CoA carboxylase biotin carboxyl carrier protein subunit n=1 Tax=Mangrovimonas futianensis TaxID=2895523 RepID=UPI001E2BEE24|nr:acetyl-CoA carboxylase biotin carboxyl carrier protein subunit [Mangrovimonas futianensis]MCF1423059.1 acetyl-CoA carboxylase biotin carboxyl carrier protein subunit [Mangrovimonas futianensis]